MQCFQRDQVVDVHHGVDPVEFLALGNPSHQCLVGATVAGWIVAQGPVGIPQGLDRRELAGFFHRHAMKPASGDFDLRPKGFVMLRIADGRRNPAHGHGGDFGSELRRDGEGESHWNYRPSSFSTSARRWSSTFKRAFNFRVPSLPISAATYYTGMRQAKGASAGAASQHRLCNNGRDDQHPPQQELRQHRVRPQSDCRVHGTMGRGGSPGGIQPDGEGRLGSVRPLSGVGRVQCV